MQNSPIKIRHLGTQDLEGAMRLKEAACWNQIPADWIALMTIEPQGCFGAELEGRLVATGTAVNYEGRFGWIGMILVDPAYRRRGIATQIMKRCQDYLSSLSCHCHKLDATDAGAKVYEKLGFQREFGVERWLRPALPTPGNLNSQTLISRLCLAHLDKLSRWDAQYFGASRQPLLRWYLDQGYPGWIIESRGQPQAFLLGRPGSFAFQIGPLMAENFDLARLLLVRCLQDMEETAVIIDVPAPNHPAFDLLKAFNFTRQRSLNRMYTGPNRYSIDPQKAFCLAGFEWG